MMLFLANLLPAFHYFGQVLCGNGGLTSTEIIGETASGTPVIWRAYPDPIGKMFYNGEHVCWSTTTEIPMSKHPSDLNVEEGAHVMLQAWITYDEEGFKDSHGKPDGTGRAAKNMWGRVKHEVQYMGIRAVPGPGGLDPALARQTDEVKPGTTGGPIPVVEISYYRKELLNTAYIQVDASDINHWDDLEICYRISQTEDKALMFHANMLAWKA